MSDHEHFMGLALSQAELALSAGEVPVGAVVVRGESILSTGFNRREQQHDPTAHAEMIAIVEAATIIGDWRLEDCTLYVTLEPCAMCAGAILQARIPRLVYGATDPKAGAVETLYRLLSDPRLNHQVDIVSGISASACGEILTRFFRYQRSLGKK